LRRAAINGGAGPLPGMADDDRPARQQINVRVLERFVSSVPVVDSCGRGQGS